MHGSAKPLHAPPQKRRTRPSRDVVIVSTWDPRLSTIRVLPSPQAIPSGLKTTSGLETVRETPVDAGPAQRAYGSHPAAPSRSMRNESDATRNRAHPPPSPAAA